MSDTTYPMVRLKPKIEARKFRRGVPWVYANEVVTDRRTKALTAGSIATLVDEHKTPIALIGVTPASKIFGRVLDFDLGAVVDQDWFKTRIQTALGLRETLYRTPHYRLIHAEADDMPGVIVDRFDDVLILQPNAAWSDVRRDMLAQALVDVTGCRTVIMNGSGRARSLEGLSDERIALIGDMPTAPLQVPMNGAIYMADVAGGQKTGLFFDQRPNHAFAAQFAKDADVLDVFSHVGGFGLAAFAAGASHVTCVDGSKPALELAQQGAELTNGTGRFETLASDAFAALEGFGVEGRQFDVVVCDPPAFAPSKAAAEAGLRAYERVARLAAPLVKQGGLLVLCSCSHAAGVDKFRTASLRGMGRAGRRAKLLHVGTAGPDHPQHTSLAENSYLKSLFFQVHR